MDEQARDLLKQPTVSLVIQIRRKTKTRFVETMEDQTVPPCDDRGSDRPCGNIDY